LLRRHFLNRLKNIPNADIVAELFQMTKEIKTPEQKQYLP